MNATMYQTGDFEVDYQVNSRPTRATNRPKAKRTGSNRRRRTAPQQFNGIHRRRKKKIRW